MLRAAKNAAENFIKEKCGLAICKREEMCYTP